MPKIKSFAGQNDISFDNQYTGSNKFVRVDNNPEIKNSEYLTPIVPIHQVPYNPQFSKSPLASVQMSRKPHLRVADTAPKNIQYNNYDADYHVQPHQNQSKCDWKKILLWALIALAVIGLAIGLYFLIDKLLSKKKQAPPMQNFNPIIPPKNQYYSGVNPVYVNPIPYNSAYNPPVTTPTISGYIDPPQSVPTPTLSYPVSQPTTTYPTVYPPSQPTPTYPTSSSSNPAATQPSVLFNTDSQNSVSPIDVYAK